MFISLPAFEVADANQPDQASSRFWRGMGISGTKPWLVATLHVVGSQELASVFLGLEHDLVPLLDTKDSRSRLVGLQRMTPPDREGAYRWRLDDVVEIWVGHGVKPGADVLRYRFAGAEGGLQALHGPDRSKPHHDLQLLVSFQGR